MRTRGLLIAAVLFAGPSAWAAPPVAAVADLATEVKLSTAERATLQARLRGQLTARRAFLLIPPAHVRDARRQLRREALRRCGSGDCAVELGKELAAAKVIVARITQLAGGCAVSVMVFDIKSATAESASVARGGCAPPALVETLTAALDALRVPAHAGPAQEQPPSADATGLVSVYINSRPIAAPVFIDDQERGITPVRLSLVAGREHDLRVGAWPLEPVQRRFVARRWQRLTFELHRANVDKQEMATNDEYLAFGFGGGSFLDARGGRALFAGTLRIATLKWRWFFLTVFEMHFAADGKHSLGMLGPRLGLPLSLGRTGRHQLLLGSGLHFATYDPDDDNEPDPAGKMFALAPGLDYVYQASNGMAPLTLGVGVELPVAGELGDRPPYLFMASLRVGVSLTPKLRTLRR